MERAARSMRSRVGGFQRGIGGQFAAPEALRRLLRGEGIHRTLHGVGDFFTGELRRLFGQMTAACSR